MALYLDTTVGSQTANSFCTLAEAEEYFAEFPLWPTDTWDELDEAEQKLRLWYAARMMSNDFRWRFWPVYDKQALPFPRWETDEDDIEIPEDIKRAQALIALGIVHRRLVGYTDPGTAGVKSSSQIKRLKLFESLDVTLADQKNVAVDGSLFDILMQSEFLPIYELIKPYIARVTCVPGPTGPDLLDAVDSYTV